METKFTKGPWDVGTSKSLSTGVVSHTINKMQQGIRPLSQGISDAYLIAAAPDMYAELTESLDTFKAIYDISASYGAKVSIARIEALLAKARGESNE
jgi:hypothetical protein